MKEFQKQEIKSLLDRYVERYPSQAKAFNSIKGASEATLINIRKGKWGNITDEMFRNVGMQVGFNNKRKWKIVTDIAGFENTKKLVMDAKESQLYIPYIAQEGYGKTEVCKFFSEKKHLNVFWLECPEILNRKTFLIELCDVMNIDNTGTIYYLMKRVISHVRKLEDPVIILDEVDKLSDPNLYFFITLCNQLKDKCAIVVMATKYFKKRIEDGVRRGKKGFSEIYSRLGRKFVEAQAHDYNTVERICHANEIYDPEEIMKIFNQFEGDLRRVERMGHAYFKKQDEYHLKTA